MAGLCILFVLLLIFSSVKLFDVFVQVVSRNWFFFIFLFFYGFILNYLKFFNRWCADFYFSSFQCNFVKSYLIAVIDALHLPIS